MMVLVLTREVFMLVLVVNKMLIMMVLVIAKEVFKMLLVVNKVVILIVLVVVMAMFLLVLMILMVVLKTLLVVVTVMFMLVLVFLMVGTVAIYQRPVVAGGGFFLLLDLGPGAAACGMGIEINTGYSCYLKYSDSKNCQ